MEGGREMTRSAPPLTALTPALGHGWVPWPFVGVSVVLGVLVLVTPALLDSGPPAAGSLFTQADLIVDRVAAGGSTTNFYLHAASDTVRYASIAIGIATDFTFNGSYPTARLNWTWTNGTNLLELSVQVPASSIAVNISATYVGGGTAVYEGLLAFGLSNGSSGPVLGIAVGSALTPGIAAPGSVLVANLPLSIALEDCGARGCT
jgi:hypothetical protein